MGISKLLFVLLILVTMSSAAFAAQFLSDSVPESDVVLYAPEKINILDNFQIKLEIKDEDVRNFANVIDLSECKFFILHNDKITNDALIKNKMTNSLSYYEYNGEKEVILEVASVFHPYPSTIEEKGYCSITIKRAFSEKDKSNPPKLSDGATLSADKNILSKIVYDYVAVPLKIESKFPYAHEGSTNKDYFLSGNTPVGNPIKYYYKFFIEDYGQTYDKITGTAYNNDKNYIFDFKTSNYKEFFDNDPTGFDKSLFEKAQTIPMDEGVVKNLGGVSGYYRVYHSVYDVVEKKTEDDLLSLTTYYMGRVNYEGNRNLLINIQKSQARVIKRSEMESKKSENVEELNNIVKSTIIKREKINYPTYTNSKEEKTEVKKDIKERDFEIKFSSSDEKTIWNRGRKNTGKEDDTFQILVKIDAQAKDEDGKKIKSPDPEELYKDVYLVVNLHENKSQVLLEQKDVRTYKIKVDSNLETIDIAGKGPILYKGIYKPIEYAYIHLEDGTGKILTDNITFTINILDASPKINLKKSLVEVQDGQKRGISFTIEDKDSEKLKCRIIVPTNFAYKSKINPAFIEYDGKETTFVEFDCASGKESSFIYSAPNLGNFDLNGELDALSMWKLQQDTAVNLVTDLVGIGVEKRLEFLGESENFYNRVKNVDPKDFDSLKKAQQFGEAKEALDNANQISTQTQNAIKVTQAYATTKGLQNQFNETVGSGKQGWVEWGSDWGVFGIDIAQTAVGAITMAPKNIPIVGALAGKITGKLSLAFNLMTNVWKGNLKYISNVEKINRAQEFYFPYPVIIEVEDKDGFKNTEIQNIMIIYNWLEK